MVSRTGIGDFMTAIARLAAVSVDCADPAVLSDFYRRLLDAEVFFESDDFVALKGAGVMLTLQRVQNYRPPEWPGDVSPKQLHLEFAVDDLDAAEQQVISLGARRAGVQPSPDRWRVLLDPAGHPFCLMHPIPGA
ncbi:VOC family protein [Pseudarthrobacter sp. O4]|uniref:VOC family protein n=1 Tax=Pseudarthrobacter sp. O4 TaxID=3418417 RepID=UPI003CE775A3